MSMLRGDITFKLTENKNVTGFINIIVKEKDYDNPLYLFASQYRLICSINNDNILRQ